MEVERIEVELVPLLADVASAIRVRAGVKGLSVRAEFGGRIPRTVLTDPTRLRQILINLLGNAVKFTEKGCVILQAALAEDKDGKPQLRLDVIDTGIGMTAEQAARLFQPFTQADETMTRRFGGTGPLQRQANRGHSRQTPQRRHDSMIKRDECGTLALRSS